MTNVDAIIRLIASPTGHEVSFPGIRVCRLDSTNEAGQYVVAVEVGEDGDEQERYFKNPVQAAIFFELQRQRLELGFEFETGCREEAIGAKV